MRVISGSIVSSVPFRHLLKYRKSQYPRNLDTLGAGSGDKQSKSALAIKLETALSISVELQRDIVGARYLR